MKPKHSIADWLMWFTGDSEWNSQPFAIGDGNRGATNGYYAVVVADGGPAITDDEAKIQKRVRHIARLLDERCQKEIAINRERAFELFGGCDHPTIEICDECRGSGEKRHRCDCPYCTLEHEKCDECDGKGKSEESPEKRSRLLWGQLFDANLIAYVIEHAPPVASYSLRLLKNQEFSYLHIITDKWRAIVTGMKLGEGKRDYQEIIEETAAVS